MAQVITIAGERLFALKAQNNQQLDIDTFIFAFVPGQDSSAPIDRNEGLPPIGQRVHSQIVQQTGLINENAVVYSSVLDSLTGPFDFNWVGLYSSVNQTLIGIIHTPTVSKTVTVPGAAGNILNRNFVIEYSGIAELTGITVDAETWQLDYTARLNGMDELTRQLAADMNGKDWFIENGFKVVPRSTLNTFKVTAGVGYVSGLRVTLAADHILTLSSYPQFVYVDAWFDGTSESVWKGHTAFTVTNTEMDDYIDVNGRNHYVFKLARITAADAVEDLRNVDGLPQVFDNHINNKDEKHNSIYARKTTVEEIKSGKFQLGDYLEVSDRNNEIFFIEAGSSNGADKIYAGDGKRAKILIFDKITVDGILDVGSSVSQNTLACQIAIDYANVLGFDRVYLNRDIAVDGSLTDMSKLIFIGRGKLTGQYRQSCHNQSLPKGMPVISGISHFNLKVFSGVKSPVVVVMGDSICTTNGNNLYNVAGSVYDNLCNQIKKQNPDKSPIFYNRSIAGLGYSHVNSLQVPSANQPSWYNNTLPNWWANVMALQPDLVIIAFGMNDGQVMSQNDGYTMANSMNDAFNLVSQYQDQIDIVLMTPPVPSKGGKYPDFSSKFPQEGRDNAAGLIRGYAKKYGFGLIDVNRVFNIARDGFDIVEGAFERRSEGSTTLPKIFSAEEETGDFVFVADLGVITSSYFTSGFFIKYGPYGDGLSLIQINEVDANNISVANFGRKLNTVQTVKTIPKPLGQTKMTFEKDGNALRLYFNDVLVVDFTGDVFISSGGTYRPSFGHISGQLHSIYYTVYTKKPNRYMPILTDYDMWNLNSASLGTKAPWGGNGLNHPSTTGIAATYVKAFEMSRFQSNLENYTKHLSSNKSDINIKFDIDKSFVWEIEVIQKGYQGFGVGSPASYSKWLFSYTGKFVAGDTGWRGGKLVKVTGVEQDSGYNFKIPDLIFSGDTLTIPANLLLENAEALVKVKSGYKPKLLVKSQVG